MPNERFLHLVRPDCPLPPGTHVVAYCRDSGGEEQDRSVQQQIKVIHEYCYYHQLELEQIYFDEARAASNSENRDQLNKMLADLRHRFKEIKDRYRREKQAHDKPFGILFWKSNRLSRDNIETTFIKADLRMRALTIVDLVTRGDTGDPATNALIEAFQTFQDQNLLDEISENVRRGLADVVGLRDTDAEFRKYNPDWPTHDGRYLSVYPGHVPMGFKAQSIQIGVRQRKRRTATGDFEPHYVQRIVPDHANNLWERCYLAWKMRHEGAPIKEIMVTTQLYNSAGSYTTFFKHIIYTGTLSYGGKLYENFVEPLIPKEWWEEEQYHIQQRAAKLLGSKTETQYEPRRIGSRHLLAGLVFCGEMDGHEHPMYACASPRKRHKHIYRWDYYQCTIGYNSRGQRCTAKVISGAALEKAVLDTLQSQVLTHQNLRPMADNIGMFVEGNKQAIESQIAEIKTKLAEVRSVINKLADAIETGELSPALRSRLTQREAEERDLMAQLTRLEAESLQTVEFPMISDEELTEAIAQIRANITSENIDLARRTLQNFVNKIVVKQKTGTVFYTFPLSEKGSIHMVTPKIEKPNIRISP